MSSERSFSVRHTPRHIALDSSIDASLSDRAALPCYLPAIGEEKLKLVSLQYTRR